MLYTYFSSKGGCECRWVREGVGFCLRRRVEYTSRTEPTDDAANVAEQALRIRKLGGYERDEVGCGCGCGV